MKTTTMTTTASSANMTSLKTRLPLLLAEADELLSEPARLGPYSSDINDSAALEHHVAVVQVHIMEIESVQAELRAKPLLKLRLDLISALAPKKQEEQNHAAAAAASSTSPSSSSSNPSKAIQDRLCRLKRHLNALAPISRLPLEVLHIIFGLLARAAADDDALDAYERTGFAFGGSGGGYFNPCLFPSHQTWLNLTFVCHLWRELIVSDAHFWTRVPEGSAAWAQRFVERSKNEPLVVRTDMLSLSATAAPIPTASSSTRSRTLSMTTRTMNLALQTLHPHLYPGAPANNPPPRPKPKPRRPKRASARELETPLRIYLCELPRIRELALDVYTTLGALEADLRRLPARAMESLALRSHCVYVFLPDALFAGEPPERLRRLALSTCCLSAARSPLLHPRTRAALTHLSLVNVLLDVDFGGFVEMVRGLESMRELCLVNVIPPVHHRGALIVPPSILLRSVPERDKVRLGRLVRAHLAGSPFSLARFLNRLNLAPASSAAAMPRVSATFEFGRAETDELANEVLVALMASTTRCVQDLEGPIAARRVVTAMSLSSCSYDQSGIIGAVWTSEARAEGRMFGLLNDEKGEELEEEQEERESVASACAYRYAIRLRQRDASLSVADLDETFVPRAAAAWLVALQCKSHLRTIRLKGSGNDAFFGCLRALMAALTASATTAAAAAGSPTGSPTGFASLAMSMSTLPMRSVEEVVFADNVGLEWLKRNHDSPNPLLGVSGASRNAGAGAGVGAGAGGRGGGVDDLLAVFPCVRRIVFVDVDVSYGARRRVYAWLVRFVEDLVSLCATGGGGGGGGGVMPSVRFERCEGVRDGEVWEVLEGLCPRELREQTVGT